MVMIEENARARALNYSVIDGAFSVIMGSLCGGMFLTGYALKILKADPAQIGILASLPLFANLLQIFGSYIIESTGKKKGLCFLSVSLSRVLWLVIILLPLAMFSGLADLRVWIMVAVIAASSLFGSLAGVSWMAWMSELVPENIRGSYFGRRNMIAAACGTVAVLAGGRFISLFEGNDPYGFLMLFSVGLLCGLIGLFFLSRIPEVEAVEKEKVAFQFDRFLLPLKDRNFLKLIIFVSAWMFAIQIAAPFYGVFMIENLKIDFSAITILLTLATVAQIFMMKVWGPMSDRLGNKPIIIVASLVLVSVPFIWSLALPANYLVPIVAAQLLSGMFMAGATLSQFNILIKLSPAEGRSIYFALFAAVTGVISGIAPIMGGVLAKALDGISYAFFAYTISNLHIIFMVSAVMQLFTIFFIYKVYEPAAAAPVAVVMQLKNDLNPQTGIIGTTDLVMIELQKTESALKKIDRVTDEFARKSEKGIEKAIEKGEKTFKKPLDWIKEFFKS